jgi:hypothetical protein
MNFTQENELLTGFLSGLLASTFLFLLSKFVYKVLIPWYQGVVYDGVNLNGSWSERLEADDGVFYDRKFNISQQAHKLRGNAVVIKSGSRSDYTQEFQINGEIWEGYVIFNLRSTNQITLSYVTGLLRVEARGSALKGIWAYRGFKDNVGSEELVLKRSNG